MTDRANRVHLLVFSDDSEEATAHADQFCADALAAGMDSATHYPAARLQQDGFHEAHPDIAPGPDGTGFGAGKAFALRRHLESVEPGDVVICHDAGPFGPGATLRPMPHLPEAVIALCAQAPGGFIHGSALAYSAQVHRAKRDCLILLEADDAEQRRAPFVASSPLIYTRTPAALSFLDDWLASCADPRMLTDQPDREGAPNELMRRHMGADAIASVLVHQWGVAHFDLHNAAPDLLETQRRRSRSLRMPEAHLAVVAAVFDALAKPAAPEAAQGDPRDVLRNRDGREAPRILPPRLPAPVMRQELASIGSGAGGALCVDHLQHVAGQNRIVAARLHALKSMPDLRDEFWWRATAHANLDLTEALMAGARPDGAQIGQLVLNAMRLAMADMPQLADETLATCIWSRMNDDSREAFRTARGNFRSEAGSEAMAEFITRLRAQGFPDPALEDSGDLEQFDAQLKRALMDWLLLDHL